MALCPVLIHKNEITSCGILIALRITYTFYFSSEESLKLDIHVSVHHDIIYENYQQDATVNLDIWLAVHHSITYLLFPTWFTKRTRDLCIKLEIINKMQLCGIIYYSLAALHVSSVIFAHHQEHLNCITASGVTHLCRCWLVSWECCSNTPTIPAGSEIRV